MNASIDSVAIVDTVYVAMRENPATYWPIVDRALTFLSFLAVPVGWYIVHRLSEKEQTESFKKQVVLADAREIEAALMRFRETLISDMSALRLLYASGQVNFAAMEDIVKSAINRDSHAWFGIAYSHKHALLPLLPSLREELSKLAADHTAAREDILRSFDAANPNIAEKAQYAKLAADSYEALSAVVLTLGDQILEAAYAHAGAA
jgi:hypothetical protein